MRADLATARGQATTAQAAADNAAAQARTPIILCIHLKITSILVQIALAAAARDEAEARSRALSALSLGHTEGLARAHGLYDEARRR